MNNSSILAKVPKHLRSQAEVRLGCKEQLRKIFPHCERIVVTLPDDEEVINGEKILFRALIKSDGKLLHIKGDTFAEVLRQATEQAQA